MPKTYTKQKIRYTKSSEATAGVVVEELTEREVIPTFIPQMNMKAIDITDMDTEQADKLLELISDYASYVEVHQSKLFTFETWLEHSGYIDDSELIRWRTFKLDQTEFID